VFCGRDIYLLGRHEPTETDANTCSSLLVKAVDACVQSSAPSAATLTHGLYSQLVAGLPNNAQPLQEQCNAVNSTLLSRLQFYPRSDGTEADGATLLLASDQVRSLKQVVAPATH
jgi:hypothetical protein